MKTITINGIQLTVQNLYPYRYDYGKGIEVLRIDISRDDHGYPEIENALENPAGDITHFVDGEMVCVYKGYTRDFKCSYANRIYSVEITRITEMELKVAALEERVKSLEDEISFDLEQALMEAESEPAEDAQPVPFSDDDIPFK